MVQLEILDVRRASQDDRLEGFSIDRPRGGGVSEAPYLTIEGWVVGRASQAIAVEALYRGRTICWAAVHVERHDVAAALAGVEGALASGFRLPLTLSAFDDAEIEVVVVLRDRSRVPLATIATRGRWRECRGTGQPPLVSVVIPCFGQARFVGEAIESALAQTHPLIEVVVVDDGSPDNVTEVAGRYPGVRCVRQDNGGLSAARNTGIRCSNGELLVFLDADDRLLPDAVAAGLRCLDGTPQAAFAVGHFRLIAADGSPLGGHAQPAPEGETYTAFLEGNPISVPCVVLFRRSLFEAVGCFDPRVDCVADYEIYLRTARDFPLAWHDTMVAEYRRHGANMSGDPWRMLVGIRRVLDLQRPFLGGSASRRQAWRQGRRYWDRLYGKEIAERAVARLRGGRPAGALADLGRLLRYHPGDLLPLWRGALRDRG